MQEDNGQPFPARSSAGYRPLLPSAMAGGAGNSAYGYVAVAAGMGLIVGLAAALALGRAPVSAAPRPAAVLHAPASNPSTPAAVKTAPTQSSATSVHARGESKAVARPISARSALLARAKARRHRVRGLYRTLSWKMRRGHKRRPYIAPSPQLGTTQPAVLKLATEATIEPVVVRIQGFVTVTGYNVSTGTIQTYEGETYVLAEPAGDGESIAWPNYPFNVHYQCDSAGNCMLNHAGTAVVTRLVR